ncbi:aquaporin-1-like [Diaphorina citri]|uniref:Aquaporin-1-like n=1 Tax=Diaphorina citri TaxID=121845 RepID=A0A3Q0JHC8_DIACI|nr:aquaporin-1-like [Diaphorina citri]
MGKISLQIFVVYTIAQCIGATLGYSIARVTKITQVLRVPAVFLDSVSICAASSSMGFYTAVLEPHLRESRVSGAQFITWRNTFCLHFCANPTALTLVRKAVSAAGFLLTRKGRLGRTHEGASHLSFQISVIIAMVLCAAWDYKCLDKHDSLPLKFGFAVTALAIPGAQFAGCSINPARSFGPALVTGHWENHWVSRIPLVGLPRI